MAELFTWASTNGGKAQHTFRVQRVQFGGGIEQRRPDGLNNKLRVWSRVIDGVDPVVAEEIIAFLRARGGVESFLWRDDYGNLVTVVAEEVEDTPARKAGVLRVRITATFREVPT